MTEQYVVRWIDAFGKRKSSQPMRLREARVLQAQIEARYHPKEGVAVVPI